MPSGFYPNAVFRPTSMFGYSRGQHNQMLPAGICDHIAEGSKQTVDTPGFWERQGASAHFLVGKKGRVSQYVNLFDVSYGQGLASPNLDRHNPIIAQALATGGSLQPFGDGTGRVFSVDAHGCNVFNRHFISIEHEGFSGEAWTAEMLQADIALKRWIIRELTDAGRAFPLDSMDRLIGHFMLDPVHRDGCPGPNWPRATLWQAMTETEPVRTGVIRERPNLRVGPFQEADRIRVMNTGEVVQVLDNSLSYVEVETSREERGFVFHEFVVING